MLERRAEIGLRRALGGVGGALLGTVATSAIATSHGWPTLVPVSSVWGSLTAAFILGAAAGLYPAARAARLNPTDALRTA